MLAVADLWEEPWGSRALTLFLGQTEACRAETNYFGGQALSCLGLDEQAPHFSEDVNTPQLRDLYGDY